MYSTEIPLVSICCPTYNHEKYIKQTLDSFLQQKVNFPIEVIVHDDASTDNTSNIIREYAAEHPQIMPVIQPVNLMSKGLNPTVDDCLFKARGKYVTICEGDDYWIDPLKLQKQVDFLENNTDFSACFHNVNILKNGKIEKDDMMDVKDETTIYDLAKGNYIRTCSYVFRNHLINKSLNDFLSVKSVDYFIFMLIAQYGKIKKIDDIMAVYRKHDGGIWSSRDAASKFKALIKNLETFFPHFNDDVKQVLKENHAEKIFHFSYFLADNGLIEQEKEFVLSSIGNNPDTVIKKLAALIRDNSALKGQQKSLKFTIKNILNLAKNRLNK